MSRVVKERLKTVCIFILLITGLLQVGILWSYQNQGTPTSFLFRLFNSTVAISDSVARERLFIPARLILTDGSISCWILKKGSEDYETLWDEAVHGLHQIVSGKVSLSKTGESWAEITQKRGFIIDFGYTVTPELLTWFLGIQNYAQELPAARKIMVKRDILDESTSYFYIRGSDGSVYSSGAVRYDEAKSLDDIIDAVDDEGSREYRKYTTFASSKIVKENDEPDILYVSGAPKYWRYYEYNVSPPARAKDSEDLAAIMLGVEKDRYNKWTDKESTIIFTYGSNIYRYYKDGYLAYRYLGNADLSGKSGIGGPLLNAYKFIARIAEVTNSNAEIAIASVEKINENVFQFEFDYRIDGMPVRTIVDMKDGNGKLYHAIRIQADGRRVLKCDWLLRDFTKGMKGNYNDRLIDLLNSEGILFDNINIRDICSGYFIQSAEDETISPTMLIDTKDQESIAVKMLPEKGD